MYYEDERLRVIRIKEEVSQLMGQEVVFTEIHGLKRIPFKGVLTEVYDRHAIIKLDDDVHNVNVYSFSFIHLLLGEGTFGSWDKQSDPEVLLATSEGVL